MSATSNSKPSEPQTSPKVYLEGFWKPSGRRMSGVPNPNSKPLTPEFVSHVGLRQMAECREQRP